MRSTSVSSPGSGSVLVTCSWRTKTLSVEPSSVTLAKSWSM